MALKFYKVSNFKILLFLILGFIIFFILTTFAIANPIQTNAFSTSIIEIDEKAYGPKIIDSSNLDFRPILDRDVETNLESVISISFNVGGGKKNNVDNIVYDIALVDLKIDCRLLSPYLKWKLVKNQNEVFEGSFDYRFDTIRDGRLVLTNIQQDLKKYSIDKNTYDHYDFYIWLSDSCQEENILSCAFFEDQTDLLNKKISGKIEIELYAETKKELVRLSSDKMDISTCVMEDGGTNE